MNSKEETRTVWFRTWIKWLLISLLWRGLELYFYGEARESNEDTIISLVLLWYIWKSETLKLGVWTRRKTMNKSEKYSEIILLGRMPQERKIEHEQHDLYDGYQIIVPLPEPTKEISVIEHQCSYGSIMNLLEIWADGSIQGYLSAKQTLRIIERVKARESPR